MKAQLEVFRWRGKNAVLNVRTSRPFVLSKQAKLVHRVRSASYHRLGDNYHLAVQYLCNGTSCGHLDKYTFLDDPGNDALLCTRCEEIAARHGLPSAYDLVGRHLHLGKLKPIQVCECEERVEVEDS